MGRLIKRVALDFYWPCNLVWKGYINPYRAQNCDVCEGSGYNPKTKQISDDWYDFEKTGRRWANNITQDEVDALIEHDRLWEFTHTWKKGEGWKPIEPRPVVTSEQVNEWSRRGFGHDAINRHICVEARARRLGVWGACPVCNGEGEIWPSKEVQQLSENWYDDERYEPPTGEGWQLWETVTEGSPISPVFATSDELIEHLVKSGYSREAATQFVRSDKWTPSMVVVNGRVYNDIEATAIKSEDEHD